MKIKVEYLEWQELQVIFLVRLMEMRLSWVWVRKSIRSQMRTMISFSKTQEQMNLKGWIRSTVFMISVFMQVGKRKSITILLKNLRLRILPFRAKAHLIKTRSMAFLNLLCLINDFHLIIICLKKLCMLASTPGVAVWFFLTFLIAFMIGSPPDCKSRCFSLCFSLALSLISLSRFYLKVSFMFQSHFALRRSFM